MPITDRGFQLRIANDFRSWLMDPEVSVDQREKSAAVVRRLADSMKRRDPLFCYEWFFGACGLDHWGDVMRLEAIGSEEDSGIVPEPS